MMSGHGNIETAMKAAKNGAFDFIEKPFKSERLILLIEKALEDRNLKLKVQAKRKNLKLAHTKKVICQMVLMILIISLTKKIKFQLLQIN